MFGLYNFSACCRRRLRVVVAGNGNVVGILLTMYALGVNNIIEKASEILLYFRIGFYVRFSSGNCHTRINLTICTYSIYSNFELNWIELDWIILFFRSLFFYPFVQNHIRNSQTNADKRKHKHAYMYAIYDSTFAFNAMSQSYKNFHGTAEC